MHQVIYDTQDNYFRIQDTASGRYLNSSDQWVPGGAAIGADTHFENAGQTYSCLSDAGCGIRKDAWRGARGNIAWWRPRRLRWGAGGSSGTAHPGDFYAKGDESMME